MIKVPCFSCGMKRMYAREKTPLKGKKEEKILFCCPLCGNTRVVTIEEKK